MTALGRKPASCYPAETGPLAHPLLRSGYTITPADNGGWVVWSDTPPDHLGNCLGAFTSEDDLLAWLGTMHRYDKEAGAQ